MNSSKVILLALASAVLVSCGEKPEAGNSAETEETASLQDSPLSDVFLSEEPSNAISVSEARGQAEPGKELVVTGKIAGVFQPFTEGFATAVLGDVEMKTCDLTGDDGCESPWDACCADPEEVKTQRLTIQVLGEDGMPIAEGLKGINGLKEMDVLVVSGTVNETSTEENLILDLTGIFQKES
ncbi:MAG: hypothetical protein AAGF67_05250 [Verrucomicrobiota bacterium]